MIFKKKNISSLHLPHNKNTAECVPTKINAPKEVLLPMDMHSGHVAEPIVSVGDYVKVGQLIAREEGRFSSPVHATVSGKVDNDGDGVKLEWYVQSLAFSKHVVGMTAAEISAMTTQTKNNHEITTDAELLAAGCSMQITGLRDVIAKAATNAR